MSGNGESARALIVAAVVLMVGCGSGERETERAGNASAPGLDITLKTTPEPMQTGANTLEVAVLDNGRPVVDATVSTEFHMAAMPAMNMPEMRSRADLAHAGGGVYRGQGQVSMAGDWDVTVTVSRQGQEIGRTKLTVTAK